MRVDLQCFLCCAKKAMSLLEQYQVPQEQAMELMKKVYGKFSQTGSEVSAPMLMAGMMEVLEEEIGLSDAYAKPKRQYNQILSEKAEEIRRQIQKADDPFLAGLRYALTGNYIDFGAMDTVSEEKLMELLDKCQYVEADPGTAEELRAEISRAGRLVYITDNAGEIVLDGLWLEEIARLYPQLDIKVLVRGRPVLNDATEEDARLTGLSRRFHVIPNGTGIPGTSLEHVSQEAREILEEADVCIAKGQGNFESLHGCGLNIYYLFLCKCDLFVRKFQMERFSPVVVSEKNFVQTA